MMVRNLKAVLGAGRSGRINPALISKMRVAEQRVDRARDALGDIDRDSLA